MYRASQDVLGRPADQTHRYALYVAGVVQEVNQALAEPPQRIEDTWRLEQEFDNAWHQKIEVRNSVPSSENF